MRVWLAVIGSCFLLVGPVPCTGADKTVNDLLVEAQRAANKGNFDDALKAANQAVELDGKSTQALLQRGTIHEALDHLKDAVADYDKVVALDPKNADAFQRRGGAQFKQGKIKESIDDFDKYLELKPDKFPGHWQRGISYYYAGRYKDGRKQFEAGQKVFADDVENAVWCYICTVKTDGVEKARANLLKIGDDKRIPLMAIYELFKGKAKPEDVLKAAEEGKPTEKELKERLFYAHLYLGLWYEAEGDKKKTLEHMTKAAEEYKVKGYMWDVARVHLEILRKNK